MMPLLIPVTFASLILCWWQNTFLFIITGLGLVESDYVTWILASD